MAKGKRRKQTSTAAKTVGKIALASYVPGFFKIHVRYIKNNARVWAALFVAPFLAIKLFLVTISGWLSEAGAGTWKFDLIAIFLIAFCFYLAERNRKFRQFYVYFAPAIMCVSLLYWAGNGDDIRSASFLVKAALIVILTQRVGNFTITRGYEQLSEGANKHYHQGRIHYDLGEYHEAMPFLEKAASQGHFKSLFLIGEAYEKGLYYKRDRARAAGYYYKAGRKGYAKANDRYESLAARLSEAEKSAIERDMWDFLDFNPQG